MDTPFSGMMWFGAGVKPKHRQKYLVYVKVDGLPDYRPAYWDDKYGFVPLPAGIAPLGEESEKNAAIEAELAEIMADLGFSEDEAFQPDVLCTPEQFEQGCAYYTALPAPPPVWLPDPKRHEYIAEGLEEGKKDIEDFLSGYWFEPTEEDMEDEALWQEELDRDPSIAAYDHITPKMDEEDVREGIGYESYEEMLENAYQAYQKLIGFLDWVCGYAADCWKMGITLPEWLEQHSPEEIGREMPELDSTAQKMVHKWLRPRWFWKQQDTYDSMTGELHRYWNDLGEEEKEAAAHWHFDTERHSLNIERLGDTSFTDLLTERIHRLEKIFIHPGVPSLVLRHEIKMAALPFAAWYIHRNSIHDVS